MKRDLEKGIKALKQRAKREDGKKRKTRLVKGPLYSEDPDHLRDDMGLQFRDTDSEPASYSQGKNIDGFTGDSGVGLNRSEKADINQEKNQS